MMALEMLQAILGLLFALFLPGFLLTVILFKEQEYYIRIIFSIAFSIMIDTLLFFLLGGSIAQKVFFGGITFFNVAISLVVISGILAIVILKKKIRFDLKKILIECNHKSKVLLLLQILSNILLIMYLAVRVHSSIPLFLFWPLILFIIGIFLVNIFYIERKYIPICIILLEFSAVAISVFGFYGIYQLPLDTYFDVQTANNFLNNQYYYPEGGTGFSENYYGYNPILHILLGFSSLMSGLSILFITKYVFPFILRIVIMLTVYSILIKILKEEKIRTVVLVMLFVIFSHTLLNIDISRRSVASFFIFFSILNLIMYLSHKNFFNKLLIYPCLLMIILSDHSNIYVMMIIFFITYGSILFNKIILKKQIAIDIKLISKYLFFFCIFYIIYLLFLANVMIHQDSTYIIKTQQEFSSKTIKTINIAKNLFLSTTNDFFGYNKEIIYSQMNTTDDIIDGSNKYNFSDNNTLNVTANISISQIVLPSKKDIIRYQTGGYSSYSLFETFLILSGQIVYIGFCCICTLILIRRKSYLPFIMYFILSILLYILLGINYSSSIGVFSVVFFHIFAIGTSILFAIIMSEFFLKGKKIYLVIALVSILLVVISIIILDFTPSLIRSRNNPNDLSILSKTTPLEVISSADWLQTRSPDATIEIDKRVFGVYTGLYEFSTVSEYWSRELRSRNKGKLFQLLNIPAHTGNYKFTKDKQYISYIIIYNSDPSSDMSSYEIKILSRISNNNIYSNNQIQIYDNHIM